MAVIQGKKDSNNECGVTPDPIIDDWNFFGKALENCERHLLQ
jgi:hypothetical protein